MNQWDEEESDELSEPEGPEDADMDADDSVDTAPCPYCRKSIYEQAEFCPYCGSAISAEDARNRKPIWIVFGVVVCIALVVACWVL